MTNIPTSLRELLKKLEFLGMIEIGKKPCMNDMTFVDSRSWMGAFYRNRSGENRKGTMLQVEQTIDQAIVSLKEYSGTEFNYIIIKSLKKARIGIQNLAETYATSPGVVAQIRVIISNIDLQLKKYDEKDN